jgi:hypothetical protein
MASGVQREDSIVLDGVYAKMMGLAVVDSIALFVLDVPIRDNFKLENVTYII